MSKAKYADPIIGTVGDEKATSDHGGRMKLITGRESIPNFV